MYYLPMSQVTLKELADLAGGTVKGKPEFVVSEILPLDLAGPNDLSFVESSKYLKKALVLSAGALLLTPNTDNIIKKHLIEVSNPRLAYVKLLRHCYRVKFPSCIIHPSSVIDPFANIAKDVSVGPNVVIEKGVSVGIGSVIMAGTVVGEGAVIGADCWIYPNVVIGHNCILGDRVIIFGGAVIGGDGFGYVPDEQGHHLKIPQRGIVVLEDDVEVGANSAIDRAVAGETRIGRGTKIDNLVQIAHNIHIGEDTIIVAQAGIAGSTTIGSHVIIAGQAGVNAHITIGDNAIVGAQGGATGSVPANTFVSGCPARPHKEQMRILGALQQLPELLCRVKKLEEIIQEKR